MNQNISDNLTRDFFIEQQKKHQKHFLESVFESLINCSNSIKDSDVFWNLNIIKNVIENLNFPEKLWDNSDEIQRKIFWDAIGICAAQCISELQNEIDSLNYVINSIKSYSYSDSVLKISDDFPSVLYHATPTRNVNNIMRDGLLPIGNNKNVFLWDSKDKAIQVAARHGDFSVTLFSIDLKQLIQNGNIIYKKVSNNGIQYYTSEIYASFLNIV